MRYPILFPNNGFVREDTHRVPPFFQLGLQKFLPDYAPPGSAIALNELPYNRRMSVVEHVFPFLASLPRDILFSVQN